MIHKKQIAQIAKNILRSQKGVRNHQLMHPSREWFIGLGIATKIFVITLVWSAYTYMQHTNENITLEAPAEEQPVVYRESLVNSALELFSVREQQYNDFFFSGSAIEPIIDTPTASSTQELDETVDSQTASSSVETASSTADMSEEESAEELVEPEAAQSETQEPADTEVQPALAM